VTFADVSGVEKVLAAPAHELDGKKVTLLLLILPIVF
jgi:hypothetical protein